MLFHRVQREEAERKISEPEVMLAQTAIGTAMSGLDSVQGQRLLERLRRKTLMEKFSTWKSAVARWGLPL